MTEPSQNDVCKLNESKPKDCNQPQKFRKD